MEARVKLLLLLAVVLAIRLPFLNQPIQGDDHIYLTEAAHALTDPLHPNDVKYVFLGDEVDLRGHSHPPGNAWPLAALLVIFGDVKEIPFHAAYIVFSLIAVWAMWSLAQRFSERPVWATLLFIAVPAFMVNGASLEADLPFLAFWMAAMALFCGNRAALAAIPMACAAMMAYQSVFMIPILAAYTWIFHRRDRMRWVILLTPLVTLMAWQIFTRATTGEMPASKLAGYFATYGFRAGLSSALILGIHSWFIVFPILVPFIVWTCLRRWREPETLFLILWVKIFFLCGLPIFFAGSARYLLPIAAPMALLASTVVGQAIRLPSLANSELRSTEGRRIARPTTAWLAVAFAAQLAISLGMAAANYQHWDGYRQFALAIHSAVRGAVTTNHRVWVDNDWGLRHYLEADGALPARKGQRVRPGDIVVTTELSTNVQFTAPLAPLANTVIQPWVPFRLIGLESRSGYSSVAKGFFPFGISTGVVDRVHASMVMERHPKLEYIVTTAPEAREQIVSGVDPSDHWMSATAVLVLKPPPTPRKLRAEIYVPPHAKARRITLLLDGREVASKSWTGEGKYTFESAEPLTGSSLEIRVDATFRAPGDQRDLGVVLLGAGFAPQ